MTKILRTLSFVAIPGIALVSTSCGSKTDTYSTTGSSPYGNSPYYGPTTDTGVTPAPPSDPYTGTATGGYTPPPAAPPAPAPYTPSGGGGSHTVVRGDTLYSLSKRYGTTVNAIQSANGLSGTTIITGQTLTIPR